MSMFSGSIIVGLVRLQAYLRIPLFIPMKNLLQLETVLNILMEEVVVLQSYCQAIFKKVFVHKQIRMQRNCKISLKGSLSHVLALSKYPVEIPKYADPNS